MSGKYLISSLLTLSTCIFAAAATDMRDNVAFLASEQTCGRGMGTAGNQKTAFYLVNSFRGAGLLDISGAPTLSFTAKGKTGHNVIGLLDTDPGEHPDKYIVVGAHFDGLGTLEGQTYPCADANASGTAVLLQLAKQLSRLVGLGRRFDYNIIFVAFDGYHEELSGSKAFWEALQKGRLTDPVNGRVIRSPQVRLMIDLCQIGGSEAPEEGCGADFLILLGEDSLPEMKRGLCNTANCLSGNNLNIYRDFYGSERFTDRFYRMGDRKIFIKAGIPALFFTSGLSALTYSRNDTADSLDYAALEKRCLFIYNFLFLYLRDFI